ncbi:MAG: hypothetical protein E7594_05740, partial [Ruminococcaceae bacterium]|nr:hypothetical protein [Oscillospiraceae bacterium]
MLTMQLSNMVLTVDFAAGRITSLCIGGRERVCAPTPLFSLRLRDAQGTATVLCATDARVCSETEDGVIYSDFGVSDLSVRVHLANKQGSVAWRADVQGLDAEHFVEWIDFPMVSLPALKENNPSGDG